jgi:tetratricopeptide (TPR) repeat protein
VKSKLLLGSGAVLVAALVLLAAAPEKKPDPAEAARLNNLGCAYMNQQLFEKGLKNFQDAAALDPNLQVARLNEGIALLSLGRVDAAKEILEAAAKNDPKDPHAWYSLGMLEKNSSDTQAAVEAFRRVVELDDSDPDTWYFLGTVYSQLKQFPQAIDAFEHALKLNPLHASAQFGLSRAYQQSGDTPHAREHLTRFQYITQNKLGAAMSLAYGEQGKYSLAEESQAATVKVPPQIPVKFVDVTKEAGLPVGPTSDEVPSRESADLVDSAGPGACFLDYDNDGKIDIFFANNGTRGMSLYRNLGSGRFQDVTKQSGFDQSLRATGCTAGDYDNDGFPDVVITVDGHVQLFHNEKSGLFKNVTEGSGIKNAGFAYGVTFVDYDHDGDLDLFVLQFSKRHPPLPPGMMGDDFPGGMNELWRNNANGTFTNQTDETGLAGRHPALAAVGTDYDNDRAIDLVVTGETAIFENPREGKFISQTKLISKNNSVNSNASNSASQPVFANGVAVLDFNHDGWMDVAFTEVRGSEISGVGLWRNNRGKSFEKIVLPETNWVKAFGIAAFDYDNDGWVDLVAVGETKDGKGEVRLFRNLGPDGFKDVTADVGLDKIQLKDPRAIITGDFDNDGATDLLITQNHGPAVLLKNEGGNKNNWLRLALKGLNSNKSAIGTKIEVFSDGIRQKYEIYGSNGYLGQNSPYLTVGLGQAKQADIVRMLWPGGVLQDEIEVAANKQQEFTELDRRGSSCPTLFVWDGKHYELVADILGAGVVGHWVAPGERNISRPTEYVKVDPNMIHEKDGKLSFRLMEPMEEVVYLDQVKLLAVDHPGNEEVYPNEYFASNPPYPEFKVITSRHADARPPAGAWDDKGRDLLADLLAHKYVDGFDLLPFKGFTKPHSLTLDLGEPYRGGPLRLLMHGEIEYFTATGMYAASQAGVEATAPYVEAEVTDGPKAGEGARLTQTSKWVRVTDDMGFPAGLPRTITADLSGKLPQGTTHVRITTNLQIYWDRILIDRSQPSEDFKLNSIPLTKANLDYHGYPLQIEDQPPGNVKYRYEEVSRTGPYARQAGTYTRYGDVLPLLGAFDDKLVVFGSGEEVALEFDPAKLPPLPQGWTRDYFFMANGYEKDMDFYAAEGSTVEPLPFRRMGTYQYPGKAFPSDEEHLDYLLKYNTRFVSGNEPRGYAYEYPKPATK